MAISEEAYVYYCEKFEEYADGGRHPGSYFRFDHETPENEYRLMRELSDEGLMECMTLDEGMWKLTEFGKLGPATVFDDDSANVPMHVGDNINIHNSPIGAFAARGSTAIGTVDVSGTIAPGEFKAAVAELQHALIDSADAIDQRLYDFTTDVLRMLRRMEPQPGSLQAMLVQVQDKLDETWAADEAKKMKPGFAKLGVGLADLVKHPLAEELLGLIVKQGRS